MALSTPTDQAVALEASGRWAEAADAFRALSRGAPSHPGLAFRSGRALHFAGDHEAAVAELSRAMRLAPEAPEVHGYLGSSLRALGRPEEAAAAFERALDLAPENAWSHANLATALADQGRDGDALRSLDRALELDDGEGGIHLARAESLRALRRGPESLAAAGRAVELEPGAWRGQLALGLAARDVRDPALARAAGRRALELAPDEARVRLLVASNAESDGDLDLAEIHWRRAMELDPELVRPYYPLARAGRERNVAELEARIAAGRGEETFLRFALGHIHDRAGDAERAWENFERGNALKRLRFDARAWHGLLEGISAVATPELIRSERSAGDPDPAPVFIVGMPRSGTSLVEQILTAHPLVHGIGESDAASNVALSVDRYPEGIARLDGDELRTLAAEYTTAVGELPEGARLRTDKTPGNFKHLGLLALLFPNARVVHCRRHPFATCLSAYFTLFQADACAHAYDLDDLAACHSAYLELMEHWRADPPLPMLEVDYEDLVREPEAVSRRLLAFLDLDWDDRVLDFHRSRRAVFTASAGQVSERVHSRSLERWRAYERFLGPLARLLSP